MLIKIRFVVKLCACSELHWCEAGAQPYASHLNTPPAKAPPTADTHKHTPGLTHMSQMQAVGIRTNGITSVCCVSTYVFRCALVEPAVTSLQDTAGHKSHWHPGAISTEYFIWPPGVLNGTKKLWAMEFFPLKIRSQSFINLYPLYYLLLFQMCQKRFLSIENLSFFLLKRLILYMHSSIRIENIYLLGYMIKSCQGQNHT